MLELLRRMDAKADRMLEGLNEAKACMTRIEAIVDAIAQDLHRLTPRSCDRR